ncbi:MAG: formylglycine-generating enzyme family protein [bacterium]
MKKFSILSAALALTMLTGFLSPGLLRAESAVKSRLGVLDFGIRNFDREESIKLSVHFREEIGKSPDFIPLSRDDLEKGLVYDSIDKRKLEQYECTSEACVLQVGLRAKADLIYTGFVQEHKRVFYLITKLVDIKKRHIVFTTSERTMNREELDKLAVKLARKVLRWTDRAGDSAQKIKERRDLRIREEREAEEAFKAAQQKRYERLSRRKPGTCPEGMVLVPAGKFIRGTDKADPLHQQGDRKKKEVMVKEFCIDKHEFSYRGSKTQYTRFEWYGAKYECEEQGKRLCREHEWEKACKGPQGYAFPYGNSFKAGVCNTAELEGSSLVKGNPVKPGTKKECVSGYGVYDMSGNKKEWTGRKKITRGQYLVLRGGSYNSAPKDTRCASRIKAIPFGSKADYGFRCCK